MPRFLYPAVYHEIPAQQLISQGLAQGLRFLPLEHELPRLLRRAHFGGGEGRLAIHRGIACRWQPAVVLAQKAPKGCVVDTDAYGRMGLPPFGLQCTPPSGPRPLPLR